MSKPIGFEVIGLSILFIFAMIGVGLVITNYYKKKRIS
jgi:hypothetical protein